MKDCHCVLPQLNPLACKKCSDYIEQFDLYDDAYVFPIPSYDGFNEILKELKEIKNEN